MGVDHVAESALGFLSTPCRLDSVVDAGRHWGTSQLCPYRVLKLVREMCRDPN